MKSNSVSELITIALVFGLGSMSAAVAAAPAGSPVAVHGALSVKKGKVVDKNGNSVTLRGMSLWWSQWPEGSYFYDIASNSDNRAAATVNTLRDDWNIDVIRAAIGVDHQDGSDAGGILSNYDRERDRAVRVIDAAIAKGIYVIVDFHAHNPHEQVAKRFFTEIASKYRNSPNLIFETWNEPLEKYDWKSVIRPYHKHVISEIRKHSSNLIIAGNRTFDQHPEEAAAAPLGTYNLAYTLHFYACSHKADIRANGQLALDKGAALFITDYGVTDYSGDAGFCDAETRTWWDWMNERGIGHTNWSVTRKEEGSAVVQPYADPANGLDANERTRSGNFVRDYLRSRGS